MYKEPETFKEKFADFYKYNRKRLFRLLKLSAVCLVLIIGFKIVNVAISNYKLNKNVNAAVAEITNMVRNIRTLYAVQGRQISNVSELLISSGGVSSAMNESGQIRNVLGGKVVIVSKIDTNADLVDNKKPSFILAYQGLPHDICVKLAGLNWGDSKTGLLAEAVGSVDKNGKDSALSDIAEDRTKKIAVKDADGRVRYTKVRRRKMYTIAKPADALTQYPIPEHYAVLGCSCKKQNTCSLALHYSVYPQNM